MSQTEAGMKTLREGLAPPPLKIGNVVVAPPVVLAPMAGVTDPVYRCLMADHGAGLVTTEMVSVEGLRRNQPGSWKLCAQEPRLQVPLAVQIFGRDPEAAAEAARRLEERGVAILDLNAGCPVRKVVRQGAGASLLREPERLAFLVEAVKRAVRIPVTVKIRLGWDEQSIHVVETVRRLESSGADAVAIHARTAVQHYSGSADWSWIRRAKRAVAIPVIGNGDVDGPATAERLLRETECDGVMIGRASMGNPWIFSAIAARWGGEPRCGSSPDWAEFYETVRSHVEGFTKQRSISAGHVRKLLIWYSKGCPDAALLRNEIGELHEVEKMLDRFGAWVERIEAGALPFRRAKIQEAA